jgi:hypothetical protein
MQRYFLYLGICCLCCCQNKLPFRDGARWSVTYFWDRDEEKTANFEGFSFEFQENGLLLALHPNGITYEGRWKGTGTEIGITLAGTGTLEEMAETWDVVSRSDTRLRLRDLNEATELYKEVELVQQ